MQKNWEKEMVTKQKASKNKNNEIPIEVEKFEMKV